MLTIFNKVPWRDDQVQIPRLCHERLAIAFPMATGTSSRSMLSHKGLSLGGDAHRIHG